MPLLVVAAALSLLIPALLRKQIHLKHLVLVALLFLAFLIYFSIRQDRPGSPERAARSFLSAITDYDCDAAWDYFSSESKRAIQVATEHFRNDPQNLDTMRHLPPNLQARYTRYEEPKNFYCRDLPVFNAYRPGSVKLLKVKATTATVTVRKGIPSNFLTPGFWATSTKYEDHELHLVREGKEWKISWQP